MFWANYMEISSQMILTGRRHGGNNVIRHRKNAKKGFDRSVDRAVELGFGFCFQQKCYGGWGSG
jgi:hypothetical protein